MPEHRIFPHGSLEPLAEGLWRVVGSLPVPLERNMFVYRLGGGGLLIYSAVALDDEGMAALEALGTPEVMVVPHTMHTMDARFYKERYPDLQVVASAVAGAALDGVKVDATPEQVLAPLGVTVRPVPGAKCGEVALELPVEGGRALVFTDIFGLTEGKPGLMMRALGAPGGVGVARIVRFRQVTDKAAVRAFFEELASLPDLRVVAGCHGGYATEGCADVMRRAAASL